MNKRPGGSYAGGTSGSEPHRSQLIPILSTNVDVFRKGFLVPIILAIVVSSMTKDPLLWLVALAISGASYWFVYRLCGKEKPWYVLAGSALFTFLFLQFNVQLVSDLNQAMGPSYTAGIVEEAVKALPVLLAVLAGMLLDSPRKEEIGVLEPLDGILMGTASAVGFALWETMILYIPGTIDRYMGATNDFGFAYYKGMNLLVTRFLHTITGHMAYAGILGYAIGLAVMKPKGWKQTVLVGYGVAVVFHAIWNGFGSSETAWIAYAGAALAYAFLAACCQKAREISPNRAKLKGSIVMERSRVLAPLSRIMPSVWGPSVAPTPAVAPAMAYAAPVYQPQPAVPNPAPSPAPARPRAAASPFGPPPATVEGVFLLRVGAEWIALASGTRLTERQIPGLESPTPDHVVAEVGGHPQDPTVLGLKNLSAGAWTLLDSKGQVREILYGKSVKLSQGTRIDFGPTQGEVVK